MRTHIYFCLFLLISLPSAFAESFLSRDNIDGWLDKLGGSNHFDDSKTIDWGILPGPFSTPELGVGIGTAIIGLYRPDETDLVSQNSSIALKGFVSSTGAFGLNIENYNFFAEDKWRLFIDARINNMPTYYWGIGDSSARNNSNKEEYTVRNFSFQPKSLMRVGDSTYIGLGWDFSLMKASDLEKGDDSLLTKEDDGTSIVSSGVSTYLLYDSRDFVPNPSKGYLASLGFTHFSKELASDRRFNRLSAQFSHYYSFNAENTIAFDIHSELMEGDVPWSQLSLLGNDKRMRGYYEGRYRDRNVLTSQVEYRRKFDWRHGMVLWAGMGTLSNQVSELGSKRWLPNVGVGYRFEFKPRMNIRLDYGVGQNSSGFYFQVGEAF